MSSRIGIHRRTLASYETGTSNMQDTTKARIVDVLRDAGVECTQYDTGDISVLLRHTAVLEGRLRLRSRSNDSSSD